MERELEPPEARLFLDGEAVANPFDGEVPQRDEPYWIEARAAGYRSVTREISIRYPQRIVMTLSPLEPEGDDGAAADAVQEL